MTRRRQHSIKSHQLCLRLTDRQMELLTAYTDFKEFDSELDSIRRMIDGLEGWFKKQASQPIEAQAHSGLPTVDDGTTSLRTDAADDDDGGTSLGDFAGFPDVGLPKSTGMLED